MSITVIISPGLGNSSPDHWQSYLENKYSNVVRVQQQDWNNPQRDIWAAALDQTIEAAEGSVILVGHSCGSIAIAQWAETHSFNKKVIGALLVAPADVDSEDALDAIKGQRPLPMTELPFPSIVVCSDNDIHMSLEKSMELAKVWGCQCFVVEDAGHINADTGYGDWSQAEALIENLSNQNVLIPRE